MIIKYKLFATTGPALEKKIQQLMEKHGLTRKQAEEHIGIRDKAAQRIRQTRDLSRECRRASEPFRSPRTNAAISQAEQSGMDAARLRVKQDLDSKINSNKRKSELKEIFSFGEKGKDKPKFDLSKYGKQIKIGLGIAAGAGLAAGGYALYKHHKRKKGEED